jgi:hypothetical protein
MKHQPPRLPVSLFVILSTLICVAATQAPAQLATDTDRLMELSRRFHQDLLAGRTSIYDAMLISTDPAQAALNANQDIKLQYVSPGRLSHRDPQSECRAHARLDDVGGAPPVLSHRAGHPWEALLWDAGKVAPPHELTGRVTQMDGASSSIALDPRRGDLDCSSVDPAAENVLCRIVAA